MQDINITVKDGMVYNNNKYLGKLLDERLTTEDVNYVLDIIFWLMEGYQNLNIDTKDLYATALQMYTYEKGGFSRFLAWFMTIGSSVRSGILNLEGSEEELTRKILKENKEVYEKELKLQLLAKEKKL